VQGVPPVDGVGDDEEEIARLALYPDGHGHAYAPAGAQGSLNVALLERDARHLTLHAKTARHAIPMAAIVAWTGCPTAAVMKKVALSWKNPKIASGRSASA
jgi:hypothetical protein